MAQAGMGGGMMMKPQTADIKGDYQGIPGDQDIAGGAPAAPAGGGGSVSVSGGGGGGGNPGGGTAPM